MASPHRHLADALEHLRYPGTRKIAEVLAARDRVVFDHELFGHSAVLTHGVAP